MEPVLVVLIVFSSVTMMVKFILDYKARSRSGGAPPGSSLSTGELRQMIRGAVEEATMPLLERVERLEDRLDDEDRQRLLEAPGASLSPSPGAENAAAPKPQRTR